MRASKDSKRSSLEIAAAVCLLAATTLLAYAPVLSNGFIQFDDPVYVLDNAHVKQGLSWQALGWALRSGYASNWHPLTWLSHMSDVQVFGLNAAGHHATSLALHLINALLLFAVFTKLTGAVWKTTLVALLFALHPLHVESVAWIAERKDVLSTCFLLLTIGAYARHVEHPSHARMALVCALFALGLMSKAMLVTLPCVLLLLDVWPLKRLGARGFECARLRELAVEKLPLIALAAVSSGITFAAQRAGGAVAPIDRIPLIERSMNALVAYLRYVEKTVWPVDLAVYYPLRPHVEAIALIAAGLLLCIVTMVAARAISKHPYLIVGWLWFIGTLIPVIGLVQVGQQAFADRYTYVPAIGLFIAVVWGLDEGFARLRVRWLGALLGTLAIAALIPMTRAQVRLWKNTETLFEHTIAATGENFIAQQVLGRALLAQGDASRALEHLSEALRLMPGDLDAQMSLASALAQRGRVGEALTHLRSATRMHPDSAKAHYNLGLTLELSKALDEAVGEYQAALAIDPAYFNAHTRLASLLREKDQLDQARTHIEAALALRPQSTEPRTLLITLSAAYARNNRFPDAIALCERALNLAKNAGQALEVSLYEADLEALRNGKIPQRTTER